LWNISGSIYFIAMTARNQIKNKLSVYNKGLSVNRGWFQPHGTPQAAIGVYGTAHQSASWLSST
jgi:hypothetical protein